MRTRLCAAFLGIVICCGPLQAATFIVSDDLQFLKRADAIVIGSPLSSYTRMSEAGYVQTVSTFAIEEVIKGEITEHTVDVVEVEFSKPTRPSFRARRDSKTAAATCCF